nr:hypothetical protein [Tanacetum cinerariifolium]
MPSKPLKERATKRIEIEDSESEDRGDTAMQPVDKKKMAECRTRMKDRSHANKKTKLRYAPDVEYKTHVSKVGNRYSSIAHGDQSNLPLALANLIGTSHTLEIKSQTYYEYGTFKSFTCWTIVPTKVVAESASSSTLDVASATKSPKLKSVTRDLIEIEDSESEDRGDTAMQPVDKKKME